MPERREVGIERQGPAGVVQSLNLKARWFGPIRFAF